MRKNIEDLIKKLDYYIDLQNTMDESVEDEINITDIDAKTVKFGASYEQLYNKAIKVKEIYKVASILGILIFVGLVLLTAGLWLADLYLK